MRTKRISRQGRLSQTIIYLGKLFRMFIFQNDWKVLPMSAIVAGLVAFAVGANIYKTMEGTLTGTFALACVCIWNGFFNSIQVICRERAIVKREHRSGLHISAYMAAHVIYQAVLCVLQVIIMIFVCTSMGVVMPQKSLVTSWPILDIGITLFFITFAADMLALLVSAFARTTTAAMTIMPFLLIVQLIFSGGFFNLPEAAMPLTNLTATKWGLTALCAQGDYNSLPMVSVWNSAVKMKDIDVEGEKPVLHVLQYIEDNDLRDEVLMQTAEHNRNPDYDFNIDIVSRCWQWLIFWAAAYILIATVLLERIDKDKR